MSRRGDNIYKRKDNRWEGRYHCGYTAEGKKKYHSVYGKTYSEVKKKLTESINCQTINNNCIDISVKTLFDEWLLKIKNCVKESTFANYSMKINKHLIPFFGNMKYNMLSSKQVYEFIDKKISDGLSLKYISDILVVFKTMSRYISCEYSCNNPLVNITIPGKNKKKDVKIFDSENITVLKDYLENNMNTTSLGIFISLYTGLRIGELCALKWSNINLKKRFIAVNRTIQRVYTANNGRSTKLMITEPKTASSIRTIPIPECLFDLLNRFKNHSDFYVLSESKKPVEPRTMQYRFAKILKKANLPSVNFHSLRHFFATNCIKLGFDIKSLSEILGHSSVNITLNRYVHSSFEQKQLFMNRLTI